MLNLTELIGFGVGGGEAHRYWRFRWPSSGIGPSEMEFRGSSGGADMATDPSKAFGTCRFSSGAPYTWGDLNSRLFDGGSAVVYSNMGGTEQWVGYDFTTPFALAEVYAVDIYGVTVSATCYVDWADSPDGPWTNHRTFVPPATFDNLVIDDVNGIYACPVGYEAHSCAYNPNIFGWSDANGPYPWWKYTF